MSFEKGDFKYLNRFVKDLFKSSGRKVAISFFLQLLTGFTQSIGLIMLIPLLGFVQIIEPTSQNAKFMDLFLNFFQKIGIPVNLFTILLFYVLIVSLNSLMGNYQSVNNARIQQHMIKSLKDHLYKLIGYSEWLFISQLRLSEITQVLTQEIQRAGQLAFRLLQLTGVIVSMAAYLSVAFMLSIPMAGLAVAGGILLWLLFRRKNKYAYQLGKSSQYSMKRIYQVVLEHLTGMKVAKSFADEDRYIEEFVYHTNAFEKQKIQMVKLNANTAFVYSLGTVVMLSAFVFISVHWVGLHAASLLVMIYIFSRLLPQVSSIQVNYQQILQLLPAFQSVQNLEQQCTENRETMNRDHFTLVKLSEKIVFENVSFSYGKKNVLDQVSLIIPARKVTVITGKSGAGKSTLADLVTGLLKPVAGSIYIDDHHLDDHLMYSWRKSIGYVTQESFLFHDTIRNNLHLTNAQATESQIWEALEAASAGEMVQNFAKKLDTVVGDRGLKLSGGERQRLALARAMMRKPTLLILDEATNALDPYNEGKIIEALKKLKGKTTIIMITHKPELLKMADQVIDVDGTEAIN